MANRADVTRLCSNLTQMGVEIKPEEVQNLTRAIACRVMTDFVIVTFLASPELINQHCAVSLESHNVNSAVQPVYLNRAILWAQGFTLLSKGGSGHFGISDIIRPEPKKFNQLLQQMLKYLFFSAKMYDAVSEESGRLEEAAERIEKQREELEFLNKQLDVNQQKIAHLTAANITDLLNSALEKETALAREAEQINNEYTALKAALEKSKTELSACSEQLAVAQDQLSELQDLVVSNPEAQIAALEQLQKESLVKNELLAVKEKVAKEAANEHKSLEEKEARANKILSVAREISTAIEELDQTSRLLEERTEEGQKTIADLQFELDRLQANVESRNEQVKKIEAEESSKLDAIQTLEKEENLKKELLADREQRKIPLTNDISRIKKELKELSDLTASHEAATLADIRRKFEKGADLWERHVKEVRDFEECCLRTEEHLEERHSDLMKLVKE